MPFVGVERGLTDPDVTGVGQRRGIGLFREDDPAAGYSALAVGAQGLGDGIGRELGAGDGAVG